MITARERSTQELLVELLVRVGHIEATLDRLAPQPRLTRQDMRVLTKILPALHGQFGTAAFVTRDALECAAFRTVCQKWSAKKAGKLFARAVGVLIDDLVLERIGDERNGAVWALKTLRLARLSGAIKAA